MQSHTNKHFVVAGAANLWVKSPFPPRSGLFEKNACFNKKIKKEKFWSCKLNINSKTFPNAEITRRKYHQSTYASVARHLPSYPNDYGSIPHLAIWCTDLYKCVWVCTRVQKKLWGNIEGLAILFCWHWNFWHARHKAFVYLLKLHHSYITPICHSCYPSQAFSQQFKKTEKTISRKNSSQKYAQEPNCQNK